MSKPKQLPLTHHPGLFVVMGYGHEPQLETARPLANVEGCYSLTRSFGTAGTLFLYTTHRDMAENDNCLVLNLGLARDRTTGEVLSAQDLLDRRLATPDNIAHDKLSGNTVILCVSKCEPKACFFRSVIGTQGLLYHESDGTFVCSDTLRLLMPLLPRVELAPDALVSHFLFRAVIGPTSYFRDVYRLEHGHQAKWSGIALKSRLVQDLRPFSPPTVDRMYDASVSSFYDQAERMIAAYVTWLRQRGYGFGNLLSGGVDSSVLQLLINQSLPDDSKPQTFSYALPMPSFAHEIENARSASDFLHTRHEFVRVDPHDYPDLLRRTIEIIGQPVGAEPMPCMMVTAKYISDHHPQISFMLTGMGADSLFGAKGARRLVQLDVARRIPLAEPALRTLAVVLDPVSLNKAYGSRELARLLRATSDINSPNHPLNTRACFTDLAMVRKCFGSEIIKDAYTCRRNLEIKYFDATSIVEKAHVLYLTVMLADEKPLVTQLYRAYNRQVLYPYLDYELMQAIFAFDPRVRFYAHGRTKPIVKRILEARSEYDNVDKRKAHSGFDHDLPMWMKDGVLRDMVRAIERPAFMERTDFERKLEQPDWFTWNMLTFDLFQKHVL